MSLKNTVMQSSVVLHTMNRMFRMGVKNKDAFKHSASSCAILISPFQARHRRIRKVQEESTKKTRHVQKP